MASMRPSEPRIGLCEECEEKTGEIFCKNCSNVFCGECDKTVHVRARKDHVRELMMAGDQALILRSKKQRASVSADTHHVCTACLGRAQAAPTESEAVTLRAHPLDEAVATARTKLALAQAGASSEDVQHHRQHDDKIRELQENLDRAERAAELARKSLHARRLSDARMLATLEALLKRGEQDGEKKPPKPARESIPVVVPVSWAVPNLDALPKPYTISGLFTCAQGLREGRNGRLYIGETQHPRVVGWELHLDDPRATLQPLPPPLPCGYGLPAGGGATTVLPLEDGGLVYAVQERLYGMGSDGKPVWEQFCGCDPWGTLVRDNILYFAAWNCIGNTGAVCWAGLDEVRQKGSFDARRQMFGAEILSQPCGMAFGPHGEVLVADQGTKLIHVFQRRELGMIHVRSLGNTLRLQKPVGVFVDSHQRVYITDRYARAILVLDFVSGALITRIALEHKPWDVTVTSRGNLIVSFFDERGSPSGIQIFG
eukprot:m.243643 g.243643  ORF g.243643 m.243643 type:complete len:486 (-) comp28181_c0_seq1:56-1513(-)